MTVSLFICMGHAYRAGRKLEPHPQLGATNHDYGLWASLNSPLQPIIRIMEHVIDSYVVHFYYSEVLMYE